MSLPKPTPEQLLEVINVLSGRLHEVGYNTIYCLNCYETRSSNIFYCIKCSLWRCDKCRPIHLAIRNRLVAYLCLELEFGFPILESLLRACHIDIDVQRCDRCNGTFCTKCKTMNSHAETYLSGNGDKDRFYIYFQCVKC